MTGGLQAFRCKCYIGLCVLYLLYLHILVDYDGVLVAQKVVWPVGADRIFDQSLIGE